MGSSVNELLKLHKSHGVRNIIKKIPGSIYVFERLSSWVFALRLVSYVLYSKTILLLDPPFKSRKTRPSAVLVAITVSTNYSDLLEVCLEANANSIDKWIVITQESDIRTKQVLRKFPEVQVLFWDPNLNGADFDKGSAVRLGQKLAYRMYPNSWYLLLDSDLVLEDTSMPLVDSLNALSPKTLYGIQRQDYSSFKDFKSKKNSKSYIGSREFHGYFQLYSTPYLYQRSKDASLCDLKFRALFRDRALLASPVGHHLGQESHWRGRPLEPKDFVF